MCNSITILAEWDPEASVFVVTSEDVPGLVTEAETVDEARDKLLAMVPELCELNDLNLCGDRCTNCNHPVPIELIATRREEILLRA